LQRDGSLDGEMVRGRPQKHTGRLL